MTILRRLVRWAVAHSQALGLSFLLALVAAVVLWFFAFFVPGRRQAAIGEWRRDLSVIADTRRDLLDRRISERVEDTLFVATFPTVRALVSSARHGGSGEERGAHLGGILSSFRNVYGERSISICDAAGVVLVSSDGPAPGAEPIALAREATRSGKLRVDLVREPDGFIGFVVAVPVAGGSELAEAGAAGAVLVVGDADGLLFDLLARPVHTGRSGEVLLVRRDQESILYLSPLLFRRDPPLTFREPFETPGLAARVALAGEDSFSANVDYRNARILAATRRLTRAPWGLVVKIDEDEALAAIREDVLRTGLMGGGLLLALIAAAVGLWRALVASHEVAIARGEARFGSLVEQATDAIFLFGSDGRILRANRAAEAMYGWTRDELLSMHATDVRASGTRDALRHDMEIAATRGNLLVETRHRHADGSEFPVEVNIGLVRAGDEAVFLSIVRDITERKRAKEALGESVAALELNEQRLGVALSGIDMAVFSQNSDLVYTWMFRPQMGFLPEEVVGRTDAQLLPPEAARQTTEIKRRVLETGAAARGEISVGLSDRTLCYDVVVEPLRDADGQVVGITGASLDITERKRAEEALRKAQKVEAIGRLAGGVAHDFNNILAVILGYGELAQNQVGTGHPARGRIDEMVKAAERAAGLTRQLLAFSRKQVMQPRVLDLSSLVSGTEKMLGRLIGEDINVVINTAADLGAVKADPSQIEQVILNLAINARDAMPKGGSLTLETANVDLDADYAVVHPPAKPGRYVMLAVSDTGIGMDEETQRHIFEPFFTTKPEGQGTGLGLATVDGIAKQSDGFISVYSEPGRGTTFKVYLPRVHEKATVSGVSAALAETPGGTETVLVAEDTKALGGVIRATLEERGYTVLFASDGEEALKLAREHTGPIQLLLTDVVMPKLGGGELGKQLSALRPGIRVLYMSGYSDWVISEHGVLKEGVRLIQKPFTGGKLARAVRDALDDPEAQPAPKEARVLLVDDDVQVRKLTALILERAGYRVESVGTAKAAAEALSSGNEYVAILCDLTLQEGSGEEVVRRVREARRELCDRVIVLTGGTTDDVRERLSAAGVTEVLQKPVARDVLLQRVAAVANR